MNSTDGWYKGEMGRLYTLTQTDWEEAEQDIPE